jgi:hypothetical protein
MLGKTQPLKNGKCNYCDKLIRAPTNLDLQVGFRLLMFSSLTLPRDTFLGSKCGSYNS